MDKERNTNQIVRKDGKGCFVESLNDAFSIGRCHLAFAAYDLNRPAGERQTNLVQIYLDCGELLELCRKAESGELLLRLQDKKQKGDKTPLYQCMGGTSAEKLRRIGRPRLDGKSLSRIFQLLPGNKSDFLLVADSGPGETDEKGLLTRAHYLAWLTASYSRGEEKAFPTQEPEQIPTEPQEPEMAMF